MKMPGSRFPEMIGTMDEGTQDGILLLQSFDGHSADSDAQLEVLLQHIVAPTTRRVQTK